MKLVLDGFVNHQNCPYLFILKRETVLLYYSLTPFFKMKPFVKFQFSLMSIYYKYNPIRHFSHAYLDDDEDQCTALGFPGYPVENHLHLRQNWEDDF